MPELFPDFITNPEAFARAKLFWHELAREQAEKLGQNGEWAAWAHEEEWCADPELMDGAVVFTLYSASQHKGLRVQQSALSADPEKKPYVSSFIDVAGEGFLERPIPNLFIGAIPTDDNQELLRRLVHQWFRKDVDSTTMQKFVETEVYAKKD